MAFAHKLNARQKEFVIIALGRWASYEEILDALKLEETDVTPQAIQYYSEKYQDRILQLRADHAKNILRIYPIANRDWRILQLQNLFNSTVDKDLRCRILGQARVEIGDDVKELANAIRASGGGDNVINFISFSKEELDRSIQDRARVLNFTGCQISN